MSAPPRTRIAIAGGGICGLALAIGLCRIASPRSSPSSLPGPEEQAHGRPLPAFDVHVYEGVGAYADVGAGLALHKNAITAMSLIASEMRGVYLARVVDLVGGSDAEAEIGTSVILAHGPHAGELIAELGRAKGRKSVSRADLLTGLLGLVPPGVVEFGKRLAAVQGGLEEGSGPALRLTFQDGTTAEADCLIGADGIHSVVRAHLLGADHPAATPKNHDRWLVYRTIVPAPEMHKYIDEALTRAPSIRLGPHGHVSCIPMSKGTRFNVALAVRGAAPLPGGIDGRGQANGNGRAGAGVDDMFDKNKLAHDKNNIGTGASKNPSPPLDPSLYADYSAEARSLIAAVARDTSMTWSLGDHDHAPLFARGSVAMTGDAAHAALPFIGNGAAQALEDAAVLCNLFRAVVADDDDDGRGGGSGDDKGQAEDNGGAGAAKRSQQGVGKRIAAALKAYDAVRRPRSQAVVDLARKFGRVYVYAERDDETGGLLHEDPEKMKAVFTRAAAFTNEADLGRQNEEALRQYRGILAGQEVPATV